MEHSRRATSIQMKFPFTFGMYWRTEKIDARTKENFTHFSTNKIERHESTFPYKSKANFMTQRSFTRAQMAQTFRFSIFIIFKLIYAHELDSCRIISRESYSNNDGIAWTNDGKFIGKCPPPHRSSKYGTVKWHNTSIRVIWIPAIRLSLWRTDQRSQSLFSFLRQVWLGW